MKFFYSILRQNILLTGFKKQKVAQRAESQQIKIITMLTTTRIWHYIYLIKYII
jgi:hypothetical protein